MSTTPRERPILFSGPMVRAILEGRKTQTRRVAKPPTKAVFLPDDQWKIDVDEPGTAYVDDEAGRMRITCPFGQPGDRLWVRETWRAYEHSETGVDGILFQADNAFIPIANTREAADLWAEALHVKAKPRGVKPILDGGKYCAWTPNRHAGWRPSRHMPRWASRITLEITRVRVERVQDITEADAIEEGVGPGYMPNASGSTTCVGHRPMFAHIWNKLNASRGHGWDDNPWLWVVDFERINMNASEP